MSGNTQGFLLPPLRPKSMTIWSVSGSSGLSDGRFMAKICGSTETRTGRPCRRRRRSPCGDHRGRAPSYGGRRSRRSTSHAAAPPLSTAEKTVIATAIATCTDDWAAAVATQAVDLLGEDLWGEVESSQNSGCLPLAQAARHLLGAKDHAHEFVADILVGQSPTDQAGRVLVEILREYAKKIHIPGEEVVESPARALRIMGICICTIGANLSSCYCLADLAEAAGKERIEEALTAGLNGWAEKASTPSKH